MIGGAKNPCHLATIIYLCIVGFLFTTACSLRNDPVSGTYLNANLSSNTVRKATGFRIYEIQGAKVIEVLKPWQGAHEVRFRYVLVPRDAPVDDSLYRLGTVVSVPVERVVCTSTTHIAFLEKLGKLNTLTGISGGKLISNRFIRNGVDNGSIADIGYDRELNFEKLVAVKPDLVVTYGIENEITGFVNRLNDLNIPVVLNGEYMEEDPLGKLEWIKFMAAFFCEDALADHWFDSIAHSYNALKTMIDPLSERPVVMTGLPWKDIWYVPGNNTVLARFISDAGGTYLWNDLISDKAVPMDMESVFEKAGHAEFWINPGTAGSVKDLINRDKRFEYFPPLVNNKVFNNNLRMNETGGNDYWESGITHPHLILRDLISILHPELIPGHELWYYQELK